MGRRMEWNLCSREEASEGCLYSGECGSLGQNWGSSDSQTGGHYLLARETGNGRNSLPGES